MSALRTTSAESAHREFRQQLADGKTLDDIGPAFATVREAAKAPSASGIRRAVGRRHRCAGGDIAEMKTGEGKTLVATIAGLTLTRCPAGA